MKWRSKAQKWLQMYDSYTEFHENRLTNVGGIRVLLNEGKGRFHETYTPDINDINVKWVLDETCKQYTERLEDDV
jgi:hypothetical protein